LTRSRFEQAAQRVQAEYVIPTLLLIGLLAGRWYAAVVAAAVWPFLLGLTGDASEYATAAAFALVNVAVGVALHKVILRGLRGAWGQARRLRLG
jgi:hypothetical protein